MLWERDQALGELLVSVFQAEGFRLSRCAGLSEFEQQLHQADALLVELELSQPHLSDWREQTSVPIICMARNPADSQVAEVFDFDDLDLLRKPFSVVELLARLRALLRRQPPKAALQVDWGRAEVTVGSRRIALTAREFQVLRAFHQNRDRVLSRQWLLENLWRYSQVENDRLVDATIKRLRKKVGEGVVETVRGLGFRLGSSVQLISL